VVLSLEAIKATYPEVEHIRCYAHLQELAADHCSTAGLKVGLPAVEDTPILLPGPMSLRKGPQQFG
jgi:hypothetical protein